LFRFLDEEVDGMREFLTGNEAVVRGALRAGCDYFAGYPITPASSVLSEFVRAFADSTAVAIQTEDEIAAIGQCIGAAMAGASALTATSGPGLSLYSENIGLAQMGEVPLVIVDCQRMGPATGGATANGEGDVLFARHVTSGGYPIPVFSATNAATAYRLTYEAFNVADRLRTPVIVLLSKDIALTRQTVDLEAIELPPRAERTAPTNGEFRPYALNGLASVPPFAPIGGTRLTRFTGSIHDENGVLTTSRDKISNMLTHLHTKIECAKDSLELVDEDLEDEANVLVVSYGLADGAAREAVQELRRRGTKVSHLCLYTLWPMAERSLIGAASGVHTLIVPELNIGLYADELRLIVPERDIVSLRRFDGGLIAPDTIIAAVEKAACEGVNQCRS
jgi:2-oxoglutarate ferredoxin oxidoreductase subunit alpha